MLHDSVTRNRFSRSTTGAPGRPAVRGLTHLTLRAAGAVCLLLLAGCSRDGAVRADLEAFDAFTDQLVERVRSADDLRAGVEAGRDLLAAQRSDLAERMARVHSVRGFQVNDETKRILAESVTRNVTKVNGLKIEMIPVTMRDAELSAALDGLVADYNALIKGG